MQRILVALFLLPLFGHAQKITRQVEPDNHTVWLVTDDVDVNYKLVSTNTLVVHFRTEGTAIFLYAQGSGQPVTVGDYAAFATDKDTVVIHATGTQPGGWHGDIPYHEYKMTRENLEYLSRHPLKQVVLSHYAGWQVVDIPAKDQNRLMPYCLAVLKAMDN